MRLLKAIGAILLALLVFRLAGGMFGPPGYLLAAVALGGWWAARSSGLTIAQLVRSIFGK